MKTLATEINYNHYCCILLVNQNVHFAQWSLCQESLAVVVANQKRPKTDKLKLYPIVIHLHLH